MPKKYIFLNISLIILIILVSTFGTYFSPLNQRFLYWWYNTYFDWLSIFLIICASVVFALIISLQRIKNWPYKEKFLKVFCVLNVLILFFLIFLVIKYYLEVRRDIIKTEKQYVTKAKSDIKNDNITFEFAGGFSIPIYTEKTENKIDSVYKNYGITYVSTGCVYDDYTYEGQQKYKETVQPYLEKRNGKNWEQKMKREVQQLKKEKVKR